MEQELYDLKIDPELESFMPKLPDETKAELEKSLKENGCYNPIHVWNNVIVDGHNRYKICRKNNIPFSIEEHQFADKCEAMKWMLDEQNCRRNLSDVERIEAALKYKAALLKKGKETQGRRTDLLSKMTKSEEPFDTRKEIAKLAGEGVSTAKVQQVERIFATADEDTKEDLRKGRKKVGTVYREMFLKEKELPRENISRDVPDSKEDGSNAADAVQKDSKLRADRIHSFRKPLTDDINLYKAVPEIIFGEGEDLSSRWGSAVKDELGNTVLIGRNSNGPVTEYAFGNALISVSEGLGVEDIELTSEEKHLLESMDEILESLDSCVRDTLDGVNPIKVHPAFFEMMIRKLKDSFTDNSAEIFSFMWDVERLRTMRFGHDADGEESFEELLKAEQPPKQRNNNTV